MRRQSRAAPAVTGDTYPSAWSLFLSHVGKRPRPCPHPLYPGDIARVFAGRQESRERLGRHGGWHCSFVLRQRAHDLKRPSVVGKSGRARVRMIPQQARTRIPGHVVKGHMRPAL